MLGYWISSNCSYERTNHSLVFTSLHILKLGCFKILALFRFESFDWFFPKIWDDAFWRTVVNIEYFSSLNDGIFTFLIEQFRLMIKSRNCDLTNCVILLYFLVIGKLEIEVKIDYFESVFLILCVVSTISFITKTLRSNNKFEQ